MTKIVIQTSYPALAQLHPNQKILFKRRLSTGRLGNHVLGIDPFGYEKARRFKDLYTRWNFAKKELHVYSLPEKQMILFHDIPASHRIMLHVNKAAKFICLGASQKSQVCVADPQLSAQAFILIKDAQQQYGRARNHLFWSNLSQIRLNHELPFRAGSVRPFFHYSFLHDSENLQKLTCRHLAILNLLIYKRKLLHPNHAFYYQRAKFRTQLLLGPSRNKFDYVMLETIFLEFAYFSAFKQRFSAKDLGPLIATLMQQLESKVAKNQSQEEHFFLWMVQGKFNFTNKVGHFLHLLIKVKDSNGKKEFRFKVYEPNITVNHLRYITENLSTITRLTADQILGNPHSYDEGLVMAVPSGWPQDNHAFLNFDLNGYYQINVLEKNATGFLQPKEYQSFPYLDLFALNNSHVLHRIPMQALQVLHHYVKNQDTPVAIPLHYR